MQLSMHAVIVSFYLFVCGIRSDLMFSWSTPKFLTMEKAIHSNDEAKDMQMVDKAAQKKKHIV